jgi:hypothetical protein
MAKWLKFALRFIVAVTLAPIPLLLYALALFVGMSMFDGESAHGLSFYWRELRRWVSEPLRPQPAH